MDKPLKPFFDNASPDILWKTLAFELSQITGLDWSVQDCTNKRPFHHPALTALDDRK